MKKRILPILVLILPFVYFRTFSSSTNGENGNLLFFLLLWVFLFIIFAISNIVFVSLRVAQGEKSKFLLFWNMILKLAHIPVYLIIFSIGGTVALFPGGIFIIPFFMTFDYMLLILTSIYGIGGIILARREKMFSTGTSVTLGILHFFFCIDVICAVFAFYKLKSKIKKQQIKNQ